MMDRRILLASFASLLGLATFRWLRTTPAHAAEKFEVEKTDAGWRAQLTPQQYGLLRLRRLRPAAVLLGDQIRERDRLAELLSAARKCRRQDRRPDFRDTADRNSLPPLRRSPRSRVRRWAEADRLALLHGRPRAAVSSGRT